MVGAYDQDIARCYYRARYYDPQIGRFISEDPLSLGQGGFPYVDSEPTRYVDPTGLVSSDAQVQAMEGAINTLLELLPRDPDCDKWLCSNTKSRNRIAPTPEQALAQILNYRAFGVENWGIVDNGNEISVTNGQSGSLQGNPWVIVVNGNGAAFNSSYTQPGKGGKNFPLSTDNGRIKGGTNAALMFILLHELSHNMDVIQHDSGNDDAGKANNNLIRKKCKTLIHLFGG